MIARTSLATALLIVAHSTLLPAQTASVGEAGRAPAMVGGAGVVFEPQTIRVPRDSAGEMRPNQQLQLVAPPPLVRPGEFYSAPWLESLGGPSGSGRIVRTTQLTGIAERPEERGYFQMNEQLYIVPPAARPAAVGQQYMTLALAEAVDGSGQVVVPTGVLRVVEAGPAGEAAVARIVKQYGAIQPTDMIVPFDTMAVRAAAAPSRMTGGPSGQIVWIPNGRVLPTLQSYLIVNAGANQGVQLGDIFTLVRPRVQVDGVWLPEKEIARAQVVRLSPRGSTLLIVKQVETDIHVGTVARLTARIQ